MGLYNFVYNILMKQKQRRKQLNWKKTLLAIFVAFLGLAAVMAVCIFVWVQTWKTYDFPEKQGSIKYPASWVFDEKSTNVPGMWEFAVFRDTSDQYEYNAILHLIRYIPFSDMTSKEEAKKRAEGSLETKLSTYRRINSNGPVPTIREISIGGEMGYIITEQGPFDWITQYIAPLTGDETYLVNSGEYIYQFSPSKKMNKFSFIYGIILQLMIRTIRFN